MQLIKTTDISYKFISEFKEILSGKHEHIKFNNMICDISNARKLFTFITKNKHFLNINKYKILKNKIKEKIIEFHKKDIKQAKVWYRWIFNERIPC